LPQTETQVPFPPPQPRPAAHLTLTWPVLAAVILLAGALAFYLWGPNRTIIEPDTSQTVMVLEGLILEGEAVIEGEEILLPVETVRREIDPFLFWDEASQTLTVTTANRVLKMKTDQLTALLNEEPFELSVPVSLIEGVPYMPVTPFKDLYGLLLDYQENLNQVTIEFLHTAKQSATVLQTTALRRRPSLREPLYGLLQQDDQVTVWQEPVNGWYLVQTADGLLAYVREKDLLLSRPELLAPPEQTVAEPLWSPLGDKVNLVWEQVNQKNPNPETIPPLGSVNVVSPTWFYLKDEAGNVGNRADANYVNWAHEQGYRVWGLFSNSFDPELTHSVLSNEASRQAALKQVLALAELYRLDGINLDFENLLLEDKPLLVQFVRELTPLAHEQGLTVSIDVTVKSLSENWSLIYDRELLGQVVDYVALMAYDEHWAASPEAGSVASLPWVEQGLKGVLAEVPAEKILLGVPFYTRLWEEKQVDGQTEVSSRALSMDRAQELIKENGAEITFDAATGQNYATWQEGDTTYRVWLEDDVSLAARVELVHRYGLAGIAAWSRGFENPAARETIAANLRHQP